MPDAGRVQDRHIETLSVGIEINGFEPRRALLVTGRLQSELLLAAGPGEDQLALLAIEQADEDVVRRKRKGLSRGRLSGTKDQVVADKAWHDSVGDRARQ